MLRGLRVVFAHKDRLDGDLKWSSIVVLAGVE